MRTLIEDVAPCGCGWVGSREGSPDCGCGWGDLCSWRPPVTLADWAALTTEVAYSYGLHDQHAPVYRNANLGIAEAREAVSSWRTAPSADVSFYGAHHIRVMRAYWLGRLRAARARA